MKNFALTTHGQWDFADMELSSFLCCQLGRYVSLERVVDGVERGSESERMGVLGVWA